MGLTAGILLSIDGDYADDFDARFEQERRAGCVDGTTTEYNLEKIFLSLDMLVQVAGFGFAICLFFGALKSQPRLVLAWVIFVLLAFILYASRTVGLYISNWHNNFAHSPSTLALVSVIILYCSAAMFKLNQELREIQSARQGNAATPSAHLHPHHHAAAAAHATNPYAKAALEPHFERI